MKNIIVFIICLVLFSCKTYVDVKTIKNEFSELESLETHNLFKRVHKVGVNKGDKIYNRNDFEIKLPKGIINYKLGTYNIFEFNSKQIILIDSGDNEKSLNEKWEFKEVNGNDILNYLGKYWNERDFNFNALDRDVSKKRISKVYTNQNSKILLHNIKKEDYNEYIKLIKGFKYTK